MKKLAYSAGDIAEVLGISRPKAYELLNSEGFPSIRLGKRIIVPVKAFEAWLENAAGR